MSNPIIDIFDHIAPHYDRMNDLMSFGLHRLWKRWWVDQLPWRALANSLTILDGASGTGDIAVLMEKRAPFYEKTLSLFCLEPSCPMRDLGRQRTCQAQWVQGSLETLPFPSSMFDLYTLAFGLRNAWERQQSLKEAYRVLKTGGIWACLEFVPRAASDWINSGYHLWRDYGIPHLGQYITGNSQAYEYLAQSIANFVPPEVIQQDLENIGFKDIHITLLLPGVVASIIAVR